MTTHQGCAWDFPDDATPFAVVRVARLVVASLKDDDSDSDAVLEEIGDCAECLRLMISVLVGMSNEVSIALATALGSDRNGALGQFEKQLAEAIQDLPR